MLCQDESGQANAAVVPSRLKVVSTDVYRQTTQEERNFYHDSGSGSFLEMIFGRYLHKKEKEKKRFLFEKRLALNLKK